tara:strand:+ start:1592 stop:2122 length:531 start_codon:yes stop_codon:yes gene_type:complete
MITILTWISITTGGILILMMLMSLIGGLDLDFDVGSADTDTDSSGGLGAIKGALTFVSVSSWVVKILLTTNNHMGFAIFVGTICGVLAIMLLNYILKLLLKNEENVNWSMNDALFKTGSVYLKIPSGKGSGIVHIDVNGAMRELKAKSNLKKDIATGADVRVTEIEGEYVYVELSS